MVAGSERVTDLDDGVVLAVEVAAFDLDAGHTVDDAVQVVWVNLPPDVSHGCGCFGRAARRGSDRRPQPYAFCGPMPLSRRMVKCAGSVMRRWPSKVTADVWPPLGGHRVAILNRLGGRSPLPEHRGMYKTVGFQQRDGKHPGRDGSAAPVLRQTGGDGGGGHCVAVGAEGVEHPLGTALGGSPVRACFSGEPGQRLPGGHRLPGSTSTVAVAPRGNNSAIGGTSKALASTRNSARSTEVRRPVSRFVIVVFCTGTPRAAQASAVCATVRLATLRASRTCSATRVVSWVDHSSFAMNAIHAPRM